MSKLSEAEAELYDRQIRLWGIESQEKLRAANVLLVGVKGLGSEIAKDILLSGINSLTILDDGSVTQEEYVKNFLLSESNLGQKIAEAVVAKAQALNPLVKITADCDKIVSKDEAFFKIFTIIIGTGLNTEQIMFLAKICRSNNIKLICGDVFGMFGYAVLDLQKHEYYEDRVVIETGKKRTRDETEKTYERKTKRVKNTIIYEDLGNVLMPSEGAKVPKRRNIYYYLFLIVMEFRSKYGRDPSHKQAQKDVKSLLQIKEDIFAKFNLDSSKLDEQVFSLLFGEVVPICSIVGGVISQEVIKAVSHKEVPINNVFLLDPLTFNGKEEIISA